MNFFILFFLIFFNYLYFIIYSDYSVCVVFFFLQFGFLMCNIIKRDLDLVFPN